MKNAAVCHGWALMLLLVVLIGGCGADNALPEQRVERARVALERGEIRTAIIELKNALQTEPDSSGARLLLGQAYARSGDGASARKELDRARELGIRKVDLQPWLARTQLLQGELEPLCELEIPVPGDASVAVRAELLRIQAQALLARGDAERAEESARRALDLEADSADGMVIMARIRASRGDVEDAREWVSKAVDVDQAHGPAWSLFGDIERSQRNLKAAEEAYTKAMQDPRLADTARLNRALILIETQQWDEARADIEQLRSRIRKDPGIDYAEGLLHYRQQNYADAARLGEAALAVDPDNTPALFLAGVSRLALGNPGSASNHLTDYLARKPDDLKAQRMLAAAKLQLGDPADAEKILYAIVDKFPEDMIALKLLTNALISQGKEEESVDYLKRVRAAQPESPETRALLGAALIDQGDSEEGIRELERALQADPTLKGAAEGIVLGHARSGNLDQALETAIGNRDNNPGSASAQLTLGLVYLLRKEQENASKAFFKALEIEPGDPGASAALSALALGEQDRGKAKAYYLESLKHHPGNATALVNLAKIAEAEGDWAAAKRYLEDAIAQAPQAVKPRLYLGQYYLAKQEPEKCLALLQGVRETNRDNPKLLALIARAQLAMARHSDARTTLEALRELIPTEPNIRIELAGIYTRLGDKQKARTELQEALRLDPNLVTAIRQLAGLEIEQKDIPGAESRARQLKSRLGSDHPDVLLLEGQIAELKGDLPVAVAAYGKLFNSAKTSSNLIELTNAQWKAGDKDAALDLMERWVEERPEDGSVQFKLGQRYLELHRNEDALARFERTLDANPKNVVAMNNMAWLLREKDPARALGYAESAHSIAPDSSAILDTFAMVLLANDDPDKAAEMIHRAVFREPDNPTLLFHQAQILEAAGSLEDARLALKTALESGKEFPEHQEARAMLRRLEAK